jgi:hypothetical protein
MILSASDAVSILGLGEDPEDVLNEVGSLASTV